MMTNLMTILERKAFISSNPRIVLSSCPPPCGHFSIQESATGGLSYKSKKTFRMNSKCPLPDSFFLFHQFFRPPFFSDFCFSSFPGIDPYLFFATKKGHLESILNDLIHHKRQEPCSSYFSFGLLRNQKFLPVLQAQIQISKS